MRRRIAGWMGGRMVLLLVALLSAPAIRLAAQCPDGSPPPCRTGQARAAPAPNSVAVLYFENLSHDTTDIYLADGLTEDVTAKLGQVGRLVVTSRATVRRMRDAAAMAMADLGRLLNVTYLVSGSVQHAGSRIRVTVELVRAATGAQVWADQYDRLTEDLLAIQEDIARAVAGGIAGRLLPAERATLAVRATRSPEAYDHYLRGNRFLWRQDEHSVLSAIAQYEAALAIDSSLTPARGRLAVSYGLALNWSYAPGGLPRDSVLARGLAAAERAIREDSTSADAWMGRGLVLFFNGRREDVDGAIESTRRAVALDPTNDVAHHQYGTLLRRVGRFAEAEREYQLARAVNPYQIQATADLGFLAYTRRRYAEAVQYYDSAVAMDTTFSSGYQLRSRARAELGDLAGALADAVRALRLAVPSERFRLSAELAEMETRNGQTERARQRLEDAFLAAGWGDGIPDTAVTVRSAYDPALAAVALGLPDVAIGILEHATPRGPWLWSYMLFPGFDPLRAEPRFIRLFDESKPPGAPEVPR